MNLLIRALAACIMMQTAVHTNALTITTSTTGSASTSNIPTSTSYQPPTTPSPPSVMPAAAVYPTYSPCGFLWLTPQTLSFLSVQDQGECNYLYARDTVTVVLWFCILVVIIIAVCSPEFPELGPSFLLKEYYLAYSFTVRPVCGCLDTYFKPLPSMMLSHAVMMVVATIMPELVVAMLMICSAVHMYCSASLETTEMKSNLVQSRLTECHPRIHYVSKSYSTMQP